MNQLCKRKPAGGLEMMLIAMKNKAIRTAAAAVSWYLSVIPANAKADAKAKVEELIEPSDPFSFMEGSGNGVFDGATSTIKETAASAYQLGVALGSACMVISIITIGLTFFVTKNSNKIDENKTRIVYLVAGGIFVFGAGWVAKTIRSGAQSLS